MHSLSVVGAGGLRFPPSIALAVPCIALIRCVGGRSLSPACHTRTPAFPFQRVMRVLHQQQVPTATVLSVFPLKPFSPGPPAGYSHVLRYLLVRCLHIREKQAPASSAGRFARQLRRDGETAPAAAARRLSRSCVRCGRPCLGVTRCCADCGVLCVRCGGRKNAVSVVEDG
jgi:hypothetical protein